MQAFASPAYPPGVGVRACALRACMVRANRHAKAFVDRLHHKTRDANSHDKLTPPDALKFACQHTHRACSQPPHNISSMATPSSTAAAMGGPLPPLLANTTSLEAAVFGGTLGVGYAGGRLSRAHSTHAYVVGQVKRTPR